MRATFRLTRDPRSLAGQLSTRSAIEDGRAAIARFSETAGERVTCSEPFDVSDDALSVTLDAVNPARDLASLAEEWQRALVQSGMQADVIA